jgi:signal peptide peptidase-like 3
MFITTLNLFSMHKQGRFSLLGLGDIIMPGLVLCFVLRFESRKRMNSTYVNDSFSFIHRLTYFQCSLVGYCAGSSSWMNRQVICLVNMSFVVGLLVATISSEVFSCAQPALLFLVPFTLAPLLMIAHLKVSSITTYEHVHFYCRSYLGRFKFNVVRSIRWE